MWYLKNKIDFERHNKETVKVWEAYHKEEPYRIPIIISGSISNLFENPEVNSTGYTFKDFFTNPQAQIEAQLAFQKWVRYNWICDKEMGPPKDGWQINIDFQNSYDQGFFGCPLKYFDNHVPDTLEVLKNDKIKLNKMKPPDPLTGGLFNRAIEFYEYMNYRCPKMEFEGLPVIPPKVLCNEGTDGPFSVACKLRGITEVCLDMLTDSKYFHELMNFVTGSIIKRMKEVRKWRWEKYPDSLDKDQFKSSEWGFADDSIALLSVDHYKEFVFPYHKKLAEEFSDGGKISIHLCGDATHLFKFLKENLNIYSFDTGFPVDFGKLRNELGSEVTIHGGPNIMLLKEGSSEKIKEEVKRVCKSGIMEGGKFVLREGNNLAPCTPIEHIKAMYDAGKEYGKY